MCFSWAELFHALLQLAQNKMLVRDRTSFTNRIQCRHEPGEIWKLSHLQNRWEDVFLCFLKGAMWSIFHKQPYRVLPGLQPHWFLPMTTLVFIVASQALRPKDIWRVDRCNGRLFLLSMSCLCVKQTISFCPNTPTWASHICSVLFKVAMFFAVQNFSFFLSLRA